VSLAPSVNKKFVPSKDFVLLFRDQAIDEQEPTALTVVGKSGHQAVGLSILPDFKIAKVKHLAVCKSKPMVDLNPSNVYAAPAAKEESKDEDDVFVEPKPNEYIFLIDRSGSMEDTILLARQALMLFLQSLIDGSSF
jgi:hypothetical protein